MFFENEKKGASLKLKSVMIICENQIFKTDL